MRSRTLSIAIAVAVVVLLGAAGAVYAYDHGRRDTIANGVRIAGIPVGGLHPDQARAKLQRELVAPLARPITVVSDQGTFHLTAREAHIGIDVDRMVQKALDRSRDGNIVTRTWRGLTGGALDADIPARVTHSDAAVSRLVARVKKAVDAPAKDASLQFAVDHLTRVEGHPGRELRAGRLRAKVDRILRRVHPGGSRTIHVKPKVVQPDVTVQDLVEKYPTVITVDRSNFQLHLFKDLKEVKTYGISVGRVGRETPAGLYDIQDKQVNPSWYVPDSDWAGDLAGKVIPPGPEDPLKARWMGIYNGAGIHGTDEVASIGHAASHGCIRMRVPDVIDLFDRVSVGTPVYIQ